MNRNNGIETSVKSVKQERTRGQKTCDKPNLHRESLSKQILDKQMKSKRDDSVESFHKKVSEYPEIPVVPEKTSANTPDAHNSGSEYRRTPDSVRLALQDPENFLMEYKRTRKIIDEVRKKREAHKISEGVSTLKRKNGIETSTESVK